MTTLRTTTSTEFQKRVYFDGSPTHIFNEKCLTPLMKACMYGRSEQVKLILEDKVNNFIILLIHTIQYKINNIALKQ